MDNSIILELIEESGYFMDNVHAEKQLEYRKCSDEFEKILQKLCANMSDDERRNVLDKIFDAESGMQSVYADEYFKAGFKLGLTLAAQNFLD